MDFQNYSTETQEHWTALEVGKEYLHCITSYSGKFKKIVFTKMLEVSECSFVMTEVPGYAIAVGDWTEGMIGSPRNRFWTLETPIPPWEEPPAVSELADKLPFVKDISRS